MGSNWHMFASLYINIYQLHAVVCAQSRVLIRDSEEVALHLTPTGQCGKNGPSYIEYVLSADL